MLTSFYDSLYNFLEEESFRQDPSGILVPLLEQHCRIALGRQQHAKLREVFTAIWGEDIVSTGT